MKTLKLSKGFTLIELLVVISIISLLSSVVLASLKGAREKAILTKTVAEMKSLQVAVELYKSQFGVYPGGGDGFIYIDSYPSLSGWPQYYPTSIRSLKDLQNSALVSNKLLANPVLVPTFETCDAQCKNKGYELFYVASKNVGSFGKFDCGGVPVDNYIIYFSTNTKKINGSEATMDIYSNKYNPVSVTTSLNSPYTYCLAG